jgi:hypothetical protein
MTFASRSKALFGLGLNPWLKPRAWPSLCQICQAWPSRPVCENCMVRFAQPQARCPTCALTLTRGNCGQCVQNPPPIDACVAAVSYTFPWSECIARFKFQAEPSLGRSLAEVMRHAPWVEPALDAAHAVIAMPLSAQRTKPSSWPVTLPQTKPTPTHYDAPQTAPIKSALNATPALTMCAMPFGLSLHG